LSSDATGAITATDLRKEYGDLVALHDLNLTIRSGELVGLLGSNGAGKSTFLRIVAGLLEPTAGEISVAGNDAGSIEARAALSFVGDQPALYNDLSVREHIEYIAHVHGIEGWPPNADAVLDALNLSDRVDDLPARFSRGLRQKTGLVLGLVRPFSVLLVDEPFVGLDPAGQVALTGLLTAAAAAGAAVVVATHQLTFLEHATRVVVLREGATAYSGKLDRKRVEELLA